jgi:hypothetical protein
MVVVAQEALVDERLGKWVAERLHQHAHAAREQGLGYRECRLAHEPFER